MKDNSPFLLLVVLAGVLVLLWYVLFLLGEIV